MSRTGAINLIKPRHFEKNSEGTIKFYRLTLDLASALVVPPSAAWR